MSVHEVGEREGWCGHTSYLYVCVSGSDWDTAKGSNAPIVATNRVCNLMLDIQCVEYSLNFQKVGAVDSTCLALTRGSHLFLLFHANDRWLDR